MKKIKSWIKLILQGAMLWAGLYVLGVPPKIIMGVALILLSVTMFFLDCIKIYEESLKDKQSRSGFSAPAR